jgi:hypothetical protein
MFHRRKEHFMGCALATAAMLADATYADAENAASYADPGLLRYPHRMSRLLRELTGSRWREAWLWTARTVEDFAFPNWPVAAFVQDRWWRPRLGQWVAVKGHVLHDPGLPVPSLVRHYPLKGWYVARLFEPVAKERFQARLRPARISAVLQQLARDMAAEAAKGRRDLHDDARK